MNTDSHLLNNLFIKGDFIDQVIKWVDDELERRNNPGTENHTAPDVGE